MYHIYIKCYNWANVEVQVSMPLQLTYETRIKNNTIETNFSKTEIVVKKSLLLYKKLQNVVFGNGY